MMKNHQKRKKQLKVVQIYLSFHAQIKRNAKLQKDLEIATRKENPLNYEMPAGQFIDGMFIESILRQVFNLKDDSAIFATTSLE